MLPRNARSYLGRKSRGILSFLASWGLEFLGNDMSDPHGRFELATHLCCVECVSEYVVDG